MILNYKIPKFSFPSNPFQPEPFFTLPVFGLICSKGLSLFLCLLVGIPPLFCEKSQHQLRADGQGCKIYFYFRPNRHVSNKEDNELNFKVKSMSYFTGNGFIVHKISADLQKNNVFPSSYQQRRNIYS